MKLSEARSKASQRALTALFFIQGFVAITYIPRIPEIIDQINVSFAQWGLIVGLAGLGSLIPLFITNRLIGKFGTRPLIRISSALFVLSTMTLAWAPNGLAYFLFHAGMMFSLSFFNIAVNAQSVMLQKKLNRVIIGKFHAAWSIGAALSAAVSGLLASFMSLQLHLFLVPLLALLAFEIFAREMLRPEEDGHHEEKQAVSKVSFFKSPAQLWLLTLGLFTGVFPELVMMDWSAVFSRQVLLLNPTLGAIPYTAFTFAMIIGRLMINPLTKKYHISELSKWGGIFGSIAMLLGVIIAPGLMVDNQVLGLLLISIFFALSGLGMAPMVPSFFSAAGHVPGLTTAQALSRMSLVNTLAVIVAKIFMGALAQGVGLELAFLFPITLMFIAGLVAGAVATRAKRKEAMENAFPPSGPLSVVDEL